MKCINCNGEIYRRQRSRWKHNSIYLQQMCKAEPSCAHKQVTVYDRLVSFQTYYEPAEYEFKITCDECDEEFNEIPEGSESKDEPWESDTPDWDYGL